MPGISASPARRALVVGTVVTGAWILRIALHRRASASEAFSGSLDTWPPVVRVGTTKGT